MAIDQQRRLRDAAAEAHGAQAQGDHAGANEAWRRYILIEDALRDPQELLDEGVALSKVAIDLWLQRLNDFGAALRDLNESGVRYVIVGRLAVIRHGVVRATKDVDAVVAMDADNLARLAKLIQGWAATNPDGTPLRTAELAAGGLLPLRTPHCFVDILAEQHLPASFDEVLARADVKRLDGVEVPICSFVDLVAMKRAAGRGTDLLDLERLRDAHGALPWGRIADVARVARFLWAPRVQSVGRIVSDGRRGSSRSCC